MHTGEEWFVFSWKEFAVFALLLTLYVVMVFARKLPSMSSFQEFVDAINTAGGHILVLTLFSLYFFRTAMRFFFHILALPEDVISKDNAIIMTGIGFLTGTAFGGAWGALIKTMSGGKASNGGTPNAPDTLTPTLTPEKEVTK